MECKLTNKVVFVRISYTKYALFTLKSNCFPFTNAFIYISIKYSNIFLTISMDVCVCVYPSFNLTPIDANDKVWNLCQNP